MGRMIQLSSGDMYDEDMLPRRLNSKTGQEEAYDPTAYEPDNTPDEPQAPPPPAPVQQAPPQATSYPAMPPLPVTSPQGLTQSIMNGTSQGPAAFRNDPNSLASQAAAIQAQQAPSPAPSPVAPPQAAPTQAGQPTAPVTSPQQLTQSIMNGTSQGPGARPPSDPNSMASTAQPLSNIPQFNNPAQPVVDPAAPPAPMGAQPTVMSGGGINQAPIGTVGTPAVPAPASTSTVPPWQQALYPNQMTPPPAGGQPNTTGSNYPTTPVVTQNAPYTPPPDDSTIDRSGYTPAPPGSMTTGAIDRGTLNDDGTYSGGYGPGPTGQVDPNVPLTNGYDAQLGDMLGLDNLPQLPTNMNFGQMPMMSELFSPAFQNQYLQNMHSQAAEIGNYWDPRGFPTAQAAQMDTGAIPQVNAQTPQSFQALQFLLSGQGFDPATLTKMKANSSDSIANQGIARMSAGRLAADRAGLGGSGIDVALQDQIARENAANQTTANNQIDIQNAQQGIQNMTTGAGMELGRQTNSAQMANLVALQNASNLISAMQTNVQNLQQRNMTQYGGDQSRAMGQAGAQTNSTQNAANTYNTGSVDQAVQANQQNAANQQNWNLGQIGMNNNNATWNANSTNNNNWNAMGNLTSLINGTQAPNFTAQGTSLLPYQNPQSTGAALLSQYSSAAGR